MTLRYMYYYLLKILKHDHIYERIIGASESRAGGPQGNSFREQTLFFPNLCTKVRLPPAELWQTQVVVEFIWIHFRYYTVETVVSLPHMQTNNLSRTHLLVISQLFLASTFPSTHCLATIHLCPASQPSTSPPSSTVLIPLCVCVCVCVCVCL